MHFIPHGNKLKLDISKLDSGHLARTSLVLQALHRDNQTV